MGEGATLKHDQRLSTPHGALGTDGFVSECKDFCNLSTPHGALGTKEGEGLRIDDEISFNSTRCIRNFLPSFKSHYSEKLSTPHGALGTFKETYRSWAAAHFQLHTVH